MNKNPRSSALSASSAYLLIHVCTSYEYILDTDYTDYTVVFIYCNSVIRV